MLIYDPALSLRRVRDPLRMDELSGSLLTVAFFLRFLPINLGA